MSDMSTSDPPQVTWQVVSQTPTSVEVAGGSYVPGYAIEAQLGDGTVIHVDVAAGPGYAERAREAVAAEAAQVGAVSNMTG